MPLFSDHINTMYYSGTPSYSGSSYSAPYSYTSSTTPLGSSYSASYFNPGGNYSSHSSIASYSRAPLTPRWIPGTSRNYAPILSTISERGTSSPVRVNSPRRIPLSKRSYTPSSYIPRPININTADIDVSKDRYKSKIEDIAPELKKTPSPEKDDSSPFMPRIDGKPETGIDSSPGKQRSTIKRGRTVVRLHTIKRKERDSPRKSQAELAQEYAIVNDDGKSDVIVSPDENTELVRWRDKLSDDLTYIDKREKKTLGEKLVEKFLVKDKNDDTGTEKQRDVIEKPNEIQISAPVLLRPPLGHSPDRRCSIEMLAEQANLLDTLIRSENLSTATLDLSKLGCNDENIIASSQPVKRRRSTDQDYSLKTTKSDYSLHQSLKSQKEFKDSKHLSKRRSLKKSSSGGSICRLDSITEFSKEPLIITDLPVIEESRFSIKRNSLKTKQKNKCKAKITSTVEVSTPKSPLKFKIENVTVEEKLNTPKKEFTFSAVIEDVPTLNKLSENKDDPSFQKENTGTKTDANERILPSPEPDDGNFWDKIGKRETVYLIKRKQNLEENKLKNRRAMFWFPGNEESVDEVETNISKTESSDSIYDENNSVKNTDFEYISSQNSQPAQFDKLLNIDEDFDENNLRNIPINTISNVEQTTTDVLPQKELHETTLSNLPPTETLNETETINQVKQEVIKNSEETAIEVKNIEKKSENEVKRQINNDKSTEPKINKEVETQNKETKLKITDRGKKSVAQSIKRNESAQIKTNQKPLEEDCKKSAKISTSPRKQKQLSAKFKIEKTGSLQKAKVSETCPIHGKTDKEAVVTGSSKCGPKVGKNEIERFCTESFDDNSKNIIDGLTQVSKKRDSKDDTLSKDNKTFEETNTNIAEKEPTSTTEKTESKKIIEETKTNIAEKKLTSTTKNTESKKNLENDTEKNKIFNKEDVKTEEPLKETLNEINNIPIKQDGLNENVLEESGEDNKADDVAMKNANPEEVKQPSSGEILKPVAFSKRPIKDEPALRPLIATPRPLQKKVPQIVHSSSSEESSSEEDSSEDEDTEESESSEDSTEFFECENHPDGRTSTGSNDSGFDSSAPTSPAGFLHVKKGAESPGPSAAAAPDDALVILEKELEQSIAYTIFRKTGRFTPPARSIPRFRKYTVDDFQFIKVLGKGSFGKVLLAELRDTEYYYAVKCLKKDVVLEDDDVECTLIERKVLALGTNHPYLCHLFATFQTDSHLFFVMEYLNGGDLMFHIQQSGRFPEARARFYAAEIVSGLKFLHKRGIVYRDLKLDNILLDFEGHVRIADFGMCKLQIYLDKTADTFCGTPDYMAPEIIKGLKYNQTVDWWSFGVLLYEMLIGQSPFSGCDEDELFWSICNEMPSYPRFLSPEALSILTRLLDKDARTRLGGTDCMHGDIREQAFFHPIHWDRLDRRELEAPFKPRVRHPMDTQYFDRAFTGERPRLTAVEPQVLRSMDQEPFRGFSYTNPNATDR